MLINKYDDPVHFHEVSNFIYIYDKEHDDSDGEVIYYSTEKESFIHYNYRIRDSIIKWEKTTISPKNAVNMFFYKFLKIANKEIRSKRINTNKRPDCTYLLSFYIEHMRGMLFINNVNKIFEVSLYESNKEIKRYYFDTLKEVDSLLED